MSTARDFAEALRRQLEEHWSLAALREERGVGALWGVGARAGWFDLAGEDALAAVIAAERALGALACPLPLAEAYVAGWFLGEDQRGQVAAGTLRLTVQQARSEGQLSEHPGELDAVLLLGATSGEVALHPVTAWAPHPGMPQPAWGRLSLGSPTWTGTGGVDLVERARAVVRLARSARAAAAATEMHELAIEHAQTRCQFGKPIGSFGAVQQRTARAEIDARGCRLLIDRAAEALDQGQPDAGLAVELAVGFVNDAARRIQLDAQHTLAAVGYFEEHLGPWLFRRVHTDLAAASMLASPRGTAADRLIEEAGTLPVLSSDPAAERFRGEVRAVIEDLRGPGGREDFTAADCVAALVREGWLGMGWPAEVGGRAAGVAEQVVLNEELTYARVPVEIELASVMLLGNAILEHGSPEQRDRFLPLVRRGEMRFCLGYSEPETGSDLASLRTRAEPHPEGWVVNGQKIWTTRADQADYLWLAARTDPEAQPRHAGITVFLVPMDTPGIVVQPMTALSGERAATVFLDDVVVPDSARVGEVGGGWAVITHALAGERVLMAGIAAQLHRLLDDVLADARGARSELVGPRGSAHRRRLEQAACEIQALRALVSAAVEAEGIDAFIAAAAAGVFGGELAESFSEAMLDLFGAEALFADPGGAGAGRIEHMIRLSVMYVVGGGTNDIQRGLIARALGLPR